MQEISSMTESTLTQILIENLRRKDELNKIARAGNRRVEMRREIGNTSFRADIFISLQKDAELTAKELERGTSFIAIEVKIKDWRQGLYQAWRYNSFAEKSYLAIYKPYAKKVDVAQFVEYNVGLIVFDEESIDILNQPKKQTFRKDNVYSKTLREKIWHSLPAVKSVQPVF
jgi:hypothetical protein